ncbi:hypothetical protein [Raoultibacter massiliensis]|uniref:hypothetical protein n=1 Tax=Raoultibacter massiliensis TaxID=1852371 RepID=UPI003A8F46C2
MSKTATTNPNRENKRTSGYILVSKNIEDMEGYRFTVCSMQPRGEAPRATDRLREVMKRKVLSDLAKMKPETALPFPRKRHAKETAGKR